MRILLYISHDLRHMISGTFFQSRFRHSPVRILSSHMACVKLILLDTASTVRRNASLYEVISIRGAWHKGTVTGLSFLVRSIDHQNANSSYLDIGYRELRVARYTSSRFHVVTWLRCSFLLAPFSRILRETVICHQN